MTTWRLYLLAMDVDDTIFCFSDIMNFWHHPYYLLYSTFLSDQSSFHLVPCSYNLFLTTTLRGLVCQPKHYPGTLTITLYQHVVKCFVLRNMMEPVWIFLGERLSHTKTPQDRLSARSMKIVCKFNSNCQLDYLLNSFPFRSSQNMPTGLWWRILQSFNSKILLQPKFNGLWEILLWRMSWER